MNQNLSLYRIFYAVALAGNISKAAESLYLSQPAVSQSIRKLEQALKTDLFLRNSRGVQLTQEGEVLFSHVKSAFQSLEQAESQLKLRRELGASFCRRCGYCAPCTLGIDIPNNFVFHGYLSRYGLADWARSRYGALAAHASDCVGCGACEERCPYQLPIREMLKKVAADFGM